MPAGIPSGEPALRELPLALTRSRPEYRATADHAGAVNGPSDTSLTCWGQIEAELTPGIAINVPIPGFSSYMVTCVILLS